MSLYKVGPKIYRAGLAVAAKAKKLPTGVQAILFPGGKYSRFILTGAYPTCLRQADGYLRLSRIEKIPMRDDFCIENYVNDPRTTPEEQLITEILIPTV